jgi:hypothetical protein
MIEVRKTDIFAKWIEGLQDLCARARILVRIERLAAGNPGGVKPMVKAYRKCALITDPAIGSISKGQDKRWSPCWLAETRDCNLPGISVSIRGFVFFLLDRQDGVRSNV